MMVACQASRELRIRAEHHGKTARTPLWDQTLWLQTDGRSGLGGLTAIFAQIGPCGGVTPFSGAAPKIKNNTSKMA